MTKYKTSLSTNLSASPDSRASGDTLISGEQVFESEAVNVSVMMQDKLISWIKGYPSLTVSKGV